ncbi:MAG: MFS transporter, partial [Clostridiales bacterium]|nr:MFS transporter [Clostridiales bacterium]
MEQRAYRRQLVLFFLLISAVALGNGLSDGVYANYYHDAYRVTAAQRSFIEFPRELPGLLCILVIGALAPLGDLRAAVIAQVLACAGLTCLGLLTPAFGVMLVFLFVNSMGMHLFMPLQDSIGMAIAEPGRVGARMGQYASVRTAVGMVAGLITFFGFRLGLFSFVTPVKGIFLFGAGAFAVAIGLSIALVRSRPADRKATERRAHFVFRKKYKYYYLWTVLHGVQKQIAYVFGAWLIVDILKQPTDAMALLTIGASFLG